MRPFSSKRRVAALAAVIFVLLFLLRPGASRLKSRIISSISAGVGRPVDLGSVHIRLLPRPGFDLENLVVYDDPEFGAEPILRASEVTADLRLTSLIRGRMEIARLNLTEPSLNLVHSESGRWNLEALLERTAHIPLAPTAKTKSEPRPGFPYIEATAARINFKSGAEKKPYALTNADFSLWQDSENAWGVRLKAQPFRGDLNLNDIGLLQLNGTWQRAQAFRDTPLQFNLEWSRAQLGQFTKLLTGSDKGWRGGMQVDVTLQGTPAKLRIQSTASIEDFRRYDIPSGTALHLAANCDGEYSSLTHEFHEVLCSAPVGQGLVTVTGDVGLPGSHHYAVMVRAVNVPASAAAALMARSKKDLPDDLEADGILRGNFSLQEDAANGLRPRFEGTGEIADFKLESAANKAELGPETIPFSIAGPDISTGGKQSAGRRFARAKFPEGPRIEFGPIGMGSTRAGSATVRGWINRSGYNLTVAGETEIGKTLRAARMIGVPSLPTTAEGTAQVDLQISGPWSGPSSGAAAGFAGPQTMGTVKLRNVQVALRGAGGPVEIVSAEMQLAPDRVRVAKLNAKAAGTTWTGSMELPRGCGKPDGCVVHFVLNTGEIALDQLTEWANPGAKKRAWYQLLGPTGQTGPTVLASLRATGRVTTDHLLIHKVAATHVSANVDLSGGRLQLSDLSANFFGGTHKGEWAVDFSLKPAACKGSGSFAGISLAGLTSEMKDAWVAGTANARYEIKGPCPVEFWQSAEGTLRVDMRDGSLPRLSIGSEEPLQVTQLTGQARLHSGAIEIKNAELESPTGTYQLNGTASFKREIDLTLDRVSGETPAAAYAITGTLSEPKVEPLTTAEQAHLKPLPPK